jgi:hypothetical protein
MNNLQNSSFDVKLELSALRQKSVEERWRRVNDLEKSNELNIELLLLNLTNDPSSSLSERLRRSEMFEQNTIPPHVEFDTTLCNGITCNH